MNRKEKVKKLALNIDYHKLGVIICRAVDFDKRQINLMEARVPIIDMFLEVIERRERIARLEGKIELIEDMTTTDLIADLEDYFSILKKELANLRKEQDEKAS